MKVNLFCVGAAKAGTTSIFEFIKDIDQFGIPVDKEPHFFGEYFVHERKKYSSYDEYHNLYPQRTNKKYLVDFSTSYLYSDSAAQEIFDYNHNAKVIIVLRNPVDRALSLYNHQRRSMLEQEGLEKAFCLESKRICDGFPYGYHYVNGGLYYNQVKRYLELFPRDNVLILQFENLIRKQHEELSKLFSFLNLPDDSVDKILPRENKTGLPKSRFLQYILENEFPLKKQIKYISPLKLIKWVRDKNVGNKVEVSDEFRDRLHKFFEEDQSLLYKLLKDIK